MNAERGAIILCGGRSSRMGRDKALLPFGPDETLLERAVRIVAQVVSSEHVICVAAADQGLPALPARVRILRDPESGQGPLAALAAGLTLFGDEFGALFVCGCDSPSGVNVSKDASRVPAPSTRRKARVTASA